MSPGDGDGGAGGDGGGPNGDDGAVAEGPCTVLYVSEAAPPGGDGCVPGRALSSIVAALGAAKARRAPGAAGPIVTDIRVCQGTYGEFVLDFPVSLHGGYECQSWTTDTARVYPNLDRGYTTHVVNQGYPSAEATVRIIGAAVDSSVVVEGFTIRGGPVSGEGTVRSVGVAIADGAGPVVRDNLVLGGNTVADNGSIAMSVRGETAMSTPEIVHNVIRGGTSRSLQTFRQGSTGLFLRAEEAAQPGAQARVHDNVIEGGAGVAEGGASIGSVGLYLFTEGPGSFEHAIENNVIRGGTGTAKVDDFESVGSLGVYILRPGVTMRHNLIEGGAGKGTSAGASGEAVRTKQISSGLSFENNRVIAGEPLAATPSALTRAFAFFEGASTVLHVTNNFIAGAGRDATPARTAIFSAVGVNAGSHTVAIRHNTVLAPAGDGSILDIDTGSANVVTSLMVQNNLILGRNSDATFRLPDTCSLAAVVVFQSNIHVHPGAVLAKSASGSPCVGYRMADLEAALATAGAAVDGNLRAVDKEGECNGEVGTCQAWGCTAGARCGQALFTRWTNGYDQLLGADPGWRLDPAKPFFCNAVRVGRDVTTSSGAVPLGVVTTDYFGGARTAPGVSVGAHEVDDCE